MDTNMETNIKSHNHSYVYYTFLAGWCAESAGARLEFRKCLFSESEVNDAMHMSGQNTSGVEPGQLTDNSEMELSLLSAIVENIDAEYFPIEEIAQKYIEWCNSDPFDIGQSINMAISDAECASDMLSNAHQYNQESLSNGAMMRCIPLAICGITRDTDTIMNVATMESELTHPNPIVANVVGIYCTIIARILRKRILNEPVDCDKLLALANCLINEDIVLEWFVTAVKLTSLEEYDCIANEGYIKHAFIFVIYFLKNMTDYTYESAIKAVLMRGGDTDTNAKIVGNLFGAYYGECVPEYMSSVVLNFDCAKVDNFFFKRPEIYGIKHAVKMVCKMEDMVLNEISH